MKINFNKTCSSHMPILMEFLDKFKPAKVLEVGSGVFSTGLFVKNCKTITSIEIGNKDWFAFVSKKFKHNICFINNYSEAIDFIKGRRRLIFVDCCNPRAPIVNHSFRHSKNIIVHDTQLHWTKEIIKPEKFTKINFTMFPVSYKNHRKDAYEDRPWTTLFSCDDKVIQHFKLINESELYKKYKFPYGIKL